MTTKAEYILETLEELFPQGDYIYHLYEGWVRLKPLKPGTYDGFRHVISILKKEGKIEVYKRVARAEFRKFKDTNVSDPTWDRRYYRVTGR